MIEGPRRICVLSGPTKQVDLSRAETAINYRASLEDNVPIRILGAGPDLYKAIGLRDQLWKGMVSTIEYPRRMQGLDHHLDLYLRLKNATGEEPETVTSSVTLVQNVFYCYRALAL